MPPIDHQLATYDQFSGTFKYLQMNTKKAVMHPRYLVILARS
jgi:hypothetical protein